jgi:transposase-like protein
MNSQVLGELTSDQKIAKVFHAYGYSIPVGKDGRRLWTRKFKDEMGQRMRAGRLSVDEVAKTCGVKHETAARWKKTSEKKASGPHSTLKPKSQTSFAEIKVNSREQNVPAAPENIIFKRGGCEIQFPANYPLGKLATLIRAFEGDV